jgi:hypothetical protein
VARVVFNEINLERVLTEYLIKRANVGLSGYRTEPLLYDDPSYPFDRHENQDSIRDPGSSSIRKIPHGIRVEIKAPGAVFIEEGNAPGGVPGEITAAVPGENMYIPARGKLSIHGGKVYFVTKSVQSYGDNPNSKSHAKIHRLRRNILAAFGIRR